MKNLILLVFIAFAQISFAQYTFKEEGNKTIKLESISSIST